MSFICAIYESFNSRKMTILNQISKKLALKAVKASKYIKRSEQDNKGSFLHNQIDNTYNHNIYPICIIPIGLVINYVIN